MKNDYVDKDIDRKLVSICSASSYLHLDRETFGLGVNGRETVLPAVYEVVDVASVY
jgi:hypothetical protein